ncbi:HNH endonuclease [Leifsonia aquatica]|uniref:HNH endonuclease n=1 Tax=Leifsonia aquatica TaxID=144185 RepID=UPI000469CE68|nr:HNH endonuclease [Leifsonia aquatica]
MITPKYEQQPKPTTAESAEAYAMVKFRSLGMCEICGKARATETHHRLHRSHGGLDIIQNLLHVCGWGNHTGCHGDAHSRSDRYDNGWAVRTGNDPALRPVLYRGRLRMLTADGWAV